MEESESILGYSDNDFLAARRRKTSTPLKNSDFPSSDDEEIDEELLAKLAEAEESSEEGTIISNETDASTSQDATCIDRQGNSEVATSRDTDWKTHWGIKCNHCSEIFSSKQVFETHYMDMHDRKPVYQCSYCNKCMDHYSTFRSHRYRHITEGRFRCQECKKGFSVRSLLRVHVLSKHASIKPFSCEVCNRGFGTRPGLNLHMEKHRSVSASKQWPCDICGKVLLTSSGHKAHMAVHQQGKRFMCELCGKTFTQKVNMQQHFKGHSGEKPFACNICGKGFAEKSHLNRHNSFHSDARPFACKVCHKLYKTERCLKVHMMTHSNERPCVCSYCGKGFLSNNKLKQHYNIHTGERPYSCRFCERTFTNYPNYLKHTRRRHKVELAQLGVTPASLIHLPPAQPPVTAQPEVMLENGDPPLTIAEQPAQLVVQEQLGAQEHFLTVQSSEIVTSPHMQIIPDLILADNLMATDPLAPSPQLQPTPCASPYIKYEPHDSMDLNSQSASMDLNHDNKYELAVQPMQFQFQDQFLC